MTNKPINATIEILGKFYPIRCKESEVDLLQEAASYLNQKMKEVQETGKVINLERIAIITALNIAHQFLQQEQQKNHLAHKINQQISRLQDKLDTAINQSVQAEFIYTTE